MHRAPTRRSHGFERSLVGDSRAFDSFSLIGGPLHSLGRRLGLVRGTNTVALGLVLGPLVWVLLLPLIFKAGVTAQVFSLSAIAVHVRLLVVVPLFFVCETWLAPRVAAFTAALVSSGVVAGDGARALAAEIGQVRRWKDSWVPEAVCLLVAVVIAVNGAQVLHLGMTSAYDPARASAVGTPLAVFYWALSLTLFRFLVLRCAWLLMLWWRFLWRVSRLDLNLVPTHPDAAGGLGYLEVVQGTFAPLVVAVSAVQAAAFAEEISAGVTAFDAIYVTLAVVLLVDAVWLVAPLLVFTPKLWVCRNEGLAQYTVFASRYVGDFHRKWVGGGADAGESPLGTPDLQSLADLGNSVDRIVNMRWLPFGSLMAMQMAAAAVLPIVPVLLFKYPLAELARKLLLLMSGL